MGKLKIPTNKSDLLKENLTRTNVPDKIINPKDDKRFEKQQKDRFNASAMNFNDWNATLRKTLYEMVGYVIFDQWRSNYDDQLLIDWKKGLPPEESATNIVTLFNKNKIM